jgi:hypothetical protein
VVAVDIDLDAPSSLPPGPSFLGSVDIGRTDPAF